MVPGITHIFVRNYMETCLRDLLKMQELIDTISCVLFMHMKKNPSEHDDGSTGGGYPLQLNLTTEALVFLSATIYFIGCWLKALEHNVLERCHMYIYFL